MKVLLTILIGLVTLPTTGQNLESVDLRWKIDKNEKLSYGTVMTDIDTASFELNFGSLFKALSDSTKNGLNESKNLFHKLNQAIKNQDYITTLSNKGNGVIDIVMTTKPKEAAKDIKTNTDSKGDDEVLLQLMQSMNKGVMLRGSVYETGGIHSFWIKTNQKNLIAVFFELPTKPVKIGDKWSLDVSLIGNDQNFQCDTSYNTNEVSLTDIKVISGDTIAVLKYNIIEYVKGEFNSPSFLTDDNAQKETMMKFTHQGIAEFSVTRGRWVAYDGIMSFAATGVMTANKKTKFTLQNASR